METSPLNLAHEKQRRAEALLQEGKFEEAATCHEAVADFLGEAHVQLESSLIHVHASTLSSQDSSKFLTPIHSLVTLESLSLQRDYHKRQAAVVRMKQAQYEEYKTTLENRQKDLLNKHAARYNEKDNCTDIRIDKFDGSLRQAIYKTIDEQDSLLTLIDIKLPSTEEKSFKHPKDTGTVIEELRTVNSQLRSLVGSLLSQLEAKEEEVRQLTERLYAVSVNSNDGIRSEEHPLSLDPLPPLTPLEMPLFDFTSS
ncbi:nuclear receptor-binding factor 2 isoform X2 [Monomorium pharaonis]|uniref:nuclear receptor-binding factor 2 isoform X2 n=1 Tax=Monomorium pharaonis TaxID=307658 RepID=UPI00063EF04D|nr:nuclear receptor-binding factor 2 isoform X2 [Monomorium pharaonis]